MSELKHTPGPWQTPGDGRIFGPGEDGENIADATWWPSDDGRDSESLANANLIAAAPDLLAACEALLAASEGRTSHAMDMVREAVAKATGEAK